MGLLTTDGAGTTADFAGRLRALLPSRWFPDNAPVLTGLLTGLAQAFADLFALLSVVAAQTRLATASGVFLDLFAGDFFQFALLRRSGEQDGSYRARISRELLREKGTRAAVISVLTDLTGRAPVVFEPARPADTGGYGVALGYGAAGGYGSLEYPFQAFVTAFRPATTGVAGVAGYGVPLGGYGVGAVEYAELSTVEALVTDADIFAAVAATMPVATIGWTRIEN